MIDYCTEKIEAYTVCQTHAACFMHTLKKSDKRKTALQSHLNFLAHKLNALTRERASAFEIAEAQEGDDWNAPSEIDFGEYDSEDWR